MLCFTNLDKNWNEHKLNFVHYFSVSKQPKATTKKPKGKDVKTKSRSGFVVKDAKHGKYEGTGKNKRWVWVPRFTSQERRQLEAHWRG